MGRPRKTVFSVVALSIDSAALALQVPRAAIVRAIKAAELPAYAGPGKRVRITVADLTEWVTRTWPRTLLRSKQS
jgi:excisionase family DNA binding protein